MAKKLIMPKLGLTMKEGKISKWYKSEGDHVKVGDKLYSVETDKLTNDVEANDEGILRKIFVSEGGVVPSLAAVAVIADKEEDITSLLEGEEISSKPTPQSLPVEKEETRVKKVEDGRKVKISPVAKKLAIENNIDFESIVGTGPGGRIVLDDVEKEIEDKKKIKISPAAQKLANELNVELSSINREDRIMKDDVYRASKEGYFNYLAGPEENRVAMTNMRKIIAERMSYSNQIAPTVNFTISVNMENLKELREELKGYTNITYTDIIVKITSKLLLVYPLLNSSMDGEEIIMRNYVNMGVAVALEEGLLVPVIKNSHIKELSEISNELKDLSYRAKINQLSTDEITGGTFTITNLGMLGIESFTPIINQPESAILGVNSIIDTPIVEDGCIVIKPIMKLSLTADHRNVDGAIAALFLAKLKESLEHPLRVLI